MAGYASLDFQQESQPFASLLQTAKLPFIVKYDGSLSLDENLVTSTFAPNEPLLVHSTHRDHRLRARCVTYARESKTFIDRHCDAIIPESYEGWFAVFGDPSQQIKEPVVPHYRRISQLAISSCTKFLVAGDRSLSVLQISKRDGDELTFCPADIDPGTVLKKGQIFSIFSRVKIRKKFRKKEKVEEQKYLLASTTDGANFFVPCDGEGLFYILSTAATSVPIMRTTQIIQRYSCPVLVKLVHGKVTASSPAAFNGTFIILSTENISTTLTVSAMTHKQMYFEILHDTYLPFHLSTASRTESMEQADRILCYENQIEDCLRCIDFQINVPDLPKIDSTYMNANRDNAGTIDFTQPMPSYKGLQIIHKDIDNLKRFPPSPISTKSSEDIKMSKSAFTMDLKEIKCHVMYDRPIDRIVDIIPITHGKGLSASNSPISEPGHQPGPPPLPLRSFSESEGSASSSASQPSLPDPPLERVEMFQTPTPSESSLQDRNYENEGLQEDDSVYESSSYYGIWNFDSMRNDPDLLVCTTQDTGVSRAVEGNENDDGGDKDNATDNKNNNNGDDNNNGAIKSSEEIDAEDDNGYMLVSEIDQQSRPASYVSLSMTENIYNSPCDGTETGTSSISYLQPKTNLGRSSQISSGSHFYTTLEELHSDGNVLRDSSSSFYVNDSTYVNDSSTSENDLPYVTDLTYVNDSDYTACVSEKAAYYQNISESGQVLEGRHISSIQTLSRQQEAASPRGLQRKRFVMPSKKKYLEQSSSFDEQRGGSIASYCQVSTYEDNDYLVLEEIVDVRKRRDSFIDKLREQGVKRNTVEALRSLNENEFQSILDAEEPLPVLKELLPHMPITDVFKIGVCLKSLHECRQFPSESF